MSTVQATGGAKSATIGLTVIKADGRRLELGEPSYWHRNPVIRVVVGGYKRARFNAAVRRYRAEGLI